MSSAICERPCKMPSLPQFGLHRKCTVGTTPLQSTNRHIRLIVPRAQASNEATSARQFVGSSAPGNQQATGIYYGSNPPQSSPNTYQYVQVAPTAHNKYSAPTRQQQQYPLVQQRISHGHQDTTAVERVSGPPTSVNPGRNHINSVRLMGAVGEPEQQGRCAYAIIQVPYATKPGAQEFLLEAWDAAAVHLITLEGYQVLVDGRLAQDTARGCVKVVVNRVQLVDQGLPAATYRSSSLAGEGRFAAATALDPQQVWRQHYSTSTQTLKALASHFGVQPGSVAKVLLLYAFQTKSPLHWRVLAAEAGVGPADELHLSDFMTMIARYKEDIAAMHEAAKPGAMSPPLPVTNEGLLKVKPIREWALAMSKEDLSHYIVTEYESKHGLSMLYEVLRMAVVAEGTQGVCNFEAEFAP
ncbi:hypothetical protein Vafri_16255 [Volvox africanus]|uniref:Uncharacterized protein n=1 Tax=Volvox africanus TaxID=51714 RepID=A0A8J4BHS5_9CHLO|nr:hypothetical protein Vafri_16255 [Volvox africanus]